MPNGGSFPVGEHYEEDVERPRASTSQAEAHPGSAARQFEAFPPISLAALRETCRDLVNAFASGAKRVALVGPPGFGKTYALDVFSRAVSSSGQARIRIASQPRAEDAVLDLVDAVDDAGLRAVASQPLSGKQLIAIRPQALPILRTLMPEAVVVTMRPIGARDVRAMLEERRKQLRLPSGVLTFKALALLERLCEGNPGTLDKLMSRSIRIARAANVGRVTAQHVDLAAAELAAEAQAAAAPPPPVDPAARQPTWEPVPDNVIVFRPALVAKSGPDSAETDAVALASVKADSTPLPGAAPVRPLSVPPPPVAPPPEHRPAFAASAASAWDRLRQPLPSQAPGQAAKRFDSQALRRNAVLVGVPFLAAVAICVGYAVTWTGSDVPDQVKPFSDRIAAATPPPVAPNVAAGKPDEVELQFDDAKQPAIPPRPQPGPPPAQAERKPAAPQTQLASKMVPSLPTPGLDTNPEHQAKAAHLLDLGKAMLSIGQTNDARAMLVASAELGSAEAADLIAARFSSGPDKSAPNTP